MSWIIGRSVGSTQPSLGRVSLSLHSYQNPQFGMTINKISPSPHPSPTRGEGIKPPPRNQRFRSSRKGWTFCSAESQGAMESFLVLKVCHYEEKTSRANQAVITRKDDEQIGHGFTQRDVVIPNKSSNYQICNGLLH